MASPDPNAPKCPVTGCTNIRGSAGPKKKRVPADQDQMKRFSYCNYHRKGNGRDERKLWKAGQHEQTN